jgi:hypothetical protein
LLNRLDDRIRLFAYLQDYRERFRDDFFRPPFFPVRFRGTFAPFFRASESPIAIACLRLFTFPPLPPRPLLSVPFLRRRIALSTRLLAALPYFRPPDFFRLVDFFLAAMRDSYEEDRISLAVPVIASWSGPLQEPFQRRQL